MTSEAKSRRSLTWFRMYAEFSTDPKVQMLSEVDQRRFVMLLCLRCCNGDVTLQDEQVAFQMRISTADWQATKAILVAKNMVGEDNQPVAWDKRQYVSDTSKERVSRHRSGKKHPGNGSVTLQRPRSNVTVTAPDTESDTETDSEKPASSLVVAARENAGLLDEGEAVVIAVAKWLDPMNPPGGVPRARDWINSQRSGGYTATEIGMAYAETMTKVVAGKVFDPCRLMQGILKSNRESAGRERSAPRPPREDNLAKTHRLLAEAAARQEVH